MIKNHIRYLLLLKSNKKYKYKSYKGKKNKCYTKYTVVICSGEIHALLSFFKIPLVAPFDDGAPVS